MRTKAERRWALVFAVFVAIVTSLPYLLGYAQQGDDWRFTGYLFGVEDGNSYTAKMLLGADGNWLFRTPYTPYPQGGVLAFLPYMLLGKLTAPPGQHEQLIALFQLFRVVGTILYGLASYDFMSIYLKEVRLRRIGTALAMVGGGMGWLAVVGLSSLWQSSPLGKVLPGMNLPLEFYSPETFGFLMILGLPHLAVGRALLLWGLCDYLVPAPPGAGWVRRMRPGWLWLLMGFMQPLTVVSGWAVLGAHVAFVFVVDRLRKVRLTVKTQDTWVYLQRAVVMGLWSAPIVIYTLLAFRLDPFLRGWESQNKIISPPFHHYILAFSLVFFLAAWGIKALYRGMFGLAVEEKRVELARLPAIGWLPLAWGLAFLPLAYAPYNLQRRLPDGIWIVLLVMALVGIEGVMNASGRRWALRALVGLGFLSTFVLMVGITFNVLKPALPLYHPLNEVRALEFLGQQETDALVLASYETSNVLPAWAPLRVLVGLGPESLNLEQFKQRITCFYSTGCSDADRIAFIDEFGIRYVWYGPAERALGDWYPARLPELELIYDEGGYQIYHHAAGWR